VPQDPADFLELWTERFRALSDPSRLRVFALLMRRSHFGEELAEALGLSAATITHHVRTLRAAGLVRSQRQGRYVLHRARRDRVAELEEFWRVNAALAERLQLPSEEAISEVVLRRYLDDDQRLTQIPFAQRPRDVVLRWATHHLDMDRLYPDRELRFVLLSLSHQPETLREALLREGWLAQSGAAYRRIDREESR
jgi:ArsR family transcriptional regulator, arsenate/arsenite/antimonite-responsive transcriptional repressor